jgi:hypothetical protein
VWLCGALYYYYVRVKFFDINGNVGLPLSTSAPSQLRLSNKLPSLRISPLKGREGGGRGGRQSGVTGFSPYRLIRGK